MFSGKLKLNPEKSGICPKETIYISYINEVGITIDQPPQCCFEQAISIGTPRCETLYISALATGLFLGMSIL